MSNATPHYSNSLNHNNHTDEQLDMDDNYSQHWQQQVQVAAESRQSAQQPHRHCKERDAVRLLDRGAHEANDENKNDEGKEERNRASVTDVIRRQDWDALDFSGQGLKAIARPVFLQFTFLRRLFLDNNRLSRLDPAIGYLRLLSHLNVSGNQIAEIPPEIGMLVNLKDLQIFDNQLTSVPTEMGHLYKLEFLGLEGNPLDREIKTLLSEHGTKGLITLLRDVYQDTPEPPPREWLEFEHSEASESLSVLSYNILCDKYATISQYGYTPAKSLAWDGRRQLVLDEMTAQNGDVICLQEVDRESFQDYFQYHLAKAGYRGIFYPKSRAKTMAEKEAKLVDGCAIFYKAKNYICLDKMVVDFGSTAINRLDMKGEHDIFNRVMPRDNISVVAFLENRWTGARIMIGNAHIYWDPTYADVKLVQVAILMEQISKKAEEWSAKPPCADKAAFRYSEDDATADESPDPPPEPGPSLEYSSGPSIPLVLCGDFNSAVGTGVYDLLTKGELPGSHEDLTSRNYGNFTRDGMHHPFKLKSAYNTMGELKFTNYTPNFTGVIDYIWYSSNAMEVKGLLGNVDADYLRRVPGFPNKHFPSDHLALKAEFAIKPQRQSRMKETDRGVRKN
ncbi:uncharacterized protein KY384_008343 [Bacidia gigantensis]|uniref:uncharacterized protein n=1 Tax=Bacidia gigantensis TaxID=2732470 RepID=UPI001D057739|nr:uncharacterized protein KY384_008343 [Bacidia gigantensis]KAG8526914.1 hypothetical protein KY384_008343 [Bacidia gigantensis]